MIRIIYLHGFLSSPSSFKAQESKKWLAKCFPDIEFVCPHLSSYPVQAKKQLDQLCPSSLRDRTYLIGSSLGGFWASYLIEHGLAKRAVLVNPAVSPHQRFLSFLGVELKSYYSEETYILGQDDLKELGACETPSLADASHYLVLLQTGDEVLDYRDAAARYAECETSVEPGGNHSFEGYLRYMDKIMQFFHG